MQAIDTQNIISASVADALVQSGIKAVGKYLRLDRCTPTEITILHSKGIKVWGIWEKGFPITAKYFTGSQGMVDGLASVAFARHVGWPLHSELFCAVDYDASAQWIQHGIHDYQAEFQRAVKAHDYLASVYGSGLVGTTLVRLGLAHSFMRAGSTGWAGFEMGSPSIKQGVLDQRLHGLDVDYCEVLSPGVLW